MRIDCAAAMLELAAWGDSNFSAYQWLTLPSEAAIAVAQQSLLSLKAIDEDYSVTKLGQRMTGYGVEPSIAVMLDYAMATGDDESAQQALTLSALFSEADIFDHQAGIDGNLLARLEVVAYGAGNMMIHHNRLARVKHLAKQLARKIGVNWHYSSVDHGLVARLLLQAWPGRLAKKTRWRQRRILISERPGRQPGRRCAKRLGVRHRDHEQSWG